jgi:hypothetical protein
VAPGGAAVRGDDPAYVTYISGYISGSTGHPKALFVVQRICNFQRRRRTAAGMSGRADSFIPRLGQVTMGGLLRNANNS